MAAGGESPFILSCPGAELADMETGGTGLMSLLAQKMAYLNQKQSVHAENVANASTPGYKALEVKPFTFDAALKQASAGMMITDPRHITPASLSGVNAA